MRGFARHALLRSASLLGISLLTVSLLGTSCARHLPDPSPPGPSSGFPARVELAGQPPVTVPHRPARIVSLSPSATETLFAIGAGAQVAAVDQNSTSPQQAPRTPLSAMTADAAAVAAQQPDLVIAPTTAAQLARGLGAVGVPVLLTPAPSAVDGAYDQIEALGRATGHSGQARALTGRMRSEIAGIVASTPKPRYPLRYYHEVSPDGYTATSRTFVGNIYGLFGLANVADDAGSTFPQLSAERLVHDDPEFVVLADGKCCRVTPASAAARPGWATITAVRDHHVYPVDDDLAARWGPRVVELVRAISNAVKETASTP